MLLTILIVSRKLSLLKYLKLITKMRRKTIYYLEFEGTTWITSKTVLNWHIALKYLIYTMKNSSEHFYLRKVLEEMYLFPLLLCEAW